jgi:hypothetical protein
MRDAAPAMSQNAAQDELAIDVDVMLDVPPPQRPEDTWQALGRAIGEQRAEEILRASTPPPPPPQPQRVLVAPYIAAPPARHVLKTNTPPATRIPESLYPVELPSREPQALMSAQHPAFQWKETADASMSMQIPVRKPRALRTARLAVAGVTAASALVCVVALVMSRINADDTSSTTTSAAAQVAAPEAETKLPQSTQPTQALAADVQGSSWSKNVLGSGDRPGVSVDSLPKADPKPAPRKSKRR